MEKGGNVFFGEMGESLVDIVVDCEDMLSRVKPVFPGVKVACPEVHERKDRPRVYVLKEEQHLFGRCELSQRLCNFLGLFLAQKLKD